MRHSLQWRLTTMLCAAVTLAALLAVGTSFVLAYSEAREFQDDVLRQIASMVRAPADSTKSPTERLPNKMIEDPESRIVIVRLPQEVAPAWVPHCLSPELQTLHAPGGDMRVFVSQVATVPGSCTVVMQRTGTRDEIAVNSALRTLVPLLLLVPILAWLVLSIVRAELAPVKKMAATLDLQSAAEPMALPDKSLPQEILPFVQAINRLFQRVTVLMAQQRRFVADAAHELRSPLTVISLQADNVNNAESLITMKERIVPLLEGIARARRLTEQLLDLAHSQAEQPDNATLDLSLVARDCIATWLPTAASRGIDLGLEPGGAVSINGALPLLHRILNNGLDNAIKYSRPGSRVTVNCYADGGDGVIDIIDEGPGIEPASREQVFTPFHRLAGSVENGSGLGLAIALESASRLGGTVSLHDGPSGQGLIFRYRQTLRQSVPFAKLDRSG